MDTLGIIWAILESQYTVKLTYQIITENKKKFIEMIHLEAGHLAKKKDKK